MASTNQSPFYKKAEQEFLEATTDEERIACLEVMIRECPKHKSSENMLRNLKIRLKKLKENVEKKKRAGKPSQKGIRKAGMQAVLAGMPSSGKTTIFNILTGLSAKVSPHPFTTTEPKIGTFSFEDVKIQLIDGPPFPRHDKSIVNSTDLVLLVIQNPDEMEGCLDFLYRSKAKILVILNKTDLLEESKKRKFEAKMRSKFKLPIILFSQKATNQEISELKERIFHSFNKIRVYAKEPKKEPSSDPLILNEGSTIKDFAKKIVKDISGVRLAKIWGPSSKFPGQNAGINHQLKDKDIVELCLT